MDSFSFREYFETVGEFKVAKNPSFFGQNRKEDFKTFYSKPKMVKVKELPPHPLRDAVAVGNYKLEERLPRTQLQTGQSISYDFNVYGEGNISSIAKPTLDKTGAFDFYEPNVKQSINREGGHVTGTKAFSYFMIPKEPGNYKLGDYFQWIFFNPQTKKYDTLRSHQVVNVTGESFKNQAIGSNDLGSFYDQGEKQPWQENLRSRSARPAMPMWWMTGAISSPTRTSAWSCRSSISPRNPRCRPPMLVRRAQTIQRPP